MALDAIVAEYLGRRRAEGIANVADLDPGAMRREEELLRHRYGVGPEMAAVEDHAIAVTGGSINVRLLFPSAESQATIVFYHGGGWVIGSIDDYDALGRALARDTGCAVALIDYRKAPEHPHPTAVNDAVEAAIWVEATMTRRNGRAPLVVAGDSAGGNLAAVVAQLASKNEAPEVALQVLIYPVLDSDLDTPSYLDSANSLMLTRELMGWFWDQYVPSPLERSAVTASPARAASLRGVAPAIVIAAEHDVLRDEGQAYVERLRADGVDVLYRVFSGQMHGFFSLHGVLPASAESRVWLADQIVVALRRPNDQGETTS